jgi:hypothetical protein
MDAAKLLPEGFAFGKHRYAKGSINETCDDAV